MSTDKRKPDEDQSSGSQDTDQKHGNGYRKKPLAPFAIVDANIHNHPKILRAGRDARELFILVLCENARAGRRGFIQASNLEPWYVARQTGMTPENAAKAFQTAYDVDLLNRDGDDDLIYISGWDETWARQATPESAARMARRKAERDAAREAFSGKTKTKAETKADKKKEQTQNRGVRTKSGPVRTDDVCVSLEPPMTKGEEDKALEVIRWLHFYTGATYSTREERELIVGLLRRNYGVEQLICLAIYSADDGGLGWQDKQEPHTERYSWRVHLNPTRIFSAKHIREHITTAVSDCWEPVSTDWRPVFWKTEAQDSTASKEKL